jgi:hypothetical protein
MFWSLRKPENLRKIPLQNLHTHANLFQLLSSIIAQFDAWEDRDENLLKHVIIIRHHHSSKQSSSPPKIRLDCWGTQNIIPFREHLNLQNFMCVRLYFFCIFRVGKKVRKSLEQSLLKWKTKCGLKSWNLGWSVVCSVYNCNFAYDFVPVSSSYHSENPSVPSFSCTDLYFFPFHFFPISTCQHHQHWITFYFPLISSSDVACCVEKTIDLKWKVGTIKFLFSKIRRCSWVTWRKFWVSSFRKNNSTESDGLH